MALPSNLTVRQQIQVLPPLGETDDFALMYFPPTTGSLGVVQIPGLNDYNIYWTAINTGAGEIINVGDLQTQKGYYIRSNDKRDIFEINQILKIGDTTFKIDKITQPELQINEKTEIVSSGNLTETVSTENISKQITINVTINRV